MKLNRTVGSFDGPETTRSSETKRQLEKHLPTVTFDLGAIGKSARTGYSRTCLALRGYSAKTQQLQRE